MFPLNHFLPALYSELVTFGTIGEVQARVDFPEKIKGYVSLEVILQEGKITMFC